MLPAPTIANLAAFTGREADTYLPFADTALQQATLLFQLVTGLNEMPSDPAQAALASNAILEMADRLYLEQDYAEYMANPFQSETIGSYSYSMKSPTALKAQSGGKLGLLWWDLALERLSIDGMNLTASGSVGGGFDASLLGIDPRTGNRGIHMPGTEVDTEYRRIS